jgi:hypothetical protein
VTLRSSFDGSESQKQRLPCRGPACGKAPVAPFDIPPPHVRPHDQQQFAVLTGSHPPFSSAIRFVLSSDELLPPTATPSPPEHPPRATV